MRESITLEPIDEIPADCRVCHYDELGERAKAKVPALADERSDTDTGARTVDGAVAAELDGCDLVKYTEYYEISVG